MKPKTGLRPELPVAVSMPERHSGAFVQAFPALVLLTPFDRAPGTCHLFAVGKAAWAGTQGTHLPMTRSAQRSPSIIAGALVLPALMFGTADMSATRSP